MKYLPEFDIEPVVYIPENPNYPILDESLLKEVPDGLEIIKHPINEPYKAARYVSKGKTENLSKGVIKGEQRQSIKEWLLLFIRGNFFIPDARKNWVKPSVEFLSNYLNEQRIEHVITTGPPHSLHLIGLQLKQQLNINWIADFRDPWTTIGYHKKLKLLPFAKLKHKTLEKRVLKNADHVVVTSFITKEEFEDITSQPVTVITNGYDVEQVAPVELDTKFSVSHIGSLLSDRNPEILWKALNELLIGNQVFQANFQLNLVGTVSDEVLTSLEHNNLSQYINLKGYVSHAEAITYQRKSQVVLLIEIDSPDTRSIIPGKLFEYMSSNRPILAIGPENSDVEHLIGSTNTGVYHTYNDKRALKASLEQLFEAYQAQNLKSNAIGLEQYSRKSLTKTLANLIKSI